MACRAQELYASRLFSYARSYAESIADRWYILSAKYGLVEPSTILAPYEATLKTLGVSGQRVWSERVLASLRQIVRPCDTIIFLAGIEYRRFLIPELERLGCKVLVPLEGMPLGVQVSWLKRAATSISASRTLEQFYDLLGRLERELRGKRELRSCTGQMQWPRRGVYIFFEPGEDRSKARSVQRVVRIGTHAVGEGSKSTLWSRLHTHRGAANGGGYHRGSVFRLHLGAALQRQDRKSPVVASWGQGSTAPGAVRATEQALEQRVSAYIGAMSILWLAVDDLPGPRSDRSYIERKTIALVSSVGRLIDPPSQKWLGNDSPNKAIVASGMWNVQWVGEPIDSYILDVLDFYIDVTIGKRQPPEGSIVPRSAWDRQLSLLHED